MRLSSDMVANRRLAAFVFFRASFIFYFRPAADATGTGAVFLFLILNSESGVRSILFIGDKIDENVLTLAIGDDYLDA